MSKKLGLLATLYFSQGLPFGFFTQALPVLMREQGYSLQAIGLSTLLALPWALKFLWAPLIDRSTQAKASKRFHKKSWILAMQLAAAVVLCVPAVSAYTESIQALMIVLFTLNFIAATQDIATDGLAVDILRKRERGWGNGIQVAGYRIGMLVGGGVLLILFQELGAKATYLSMAALTVLASLPLGLTPQAKLGSRTGEQGASATTPLPRSAPSSAAPHFLRRAGAWGLLGLIVSYKVGDAFATAMLRPFLVDQGLSMADIGWLIGTVGFVAGLLGALLGGALVQRLGRRRALLAFGLLQALSVAGYALLALGTPSLGTIYALCAAEHLAGGMATAALFTCMMDWCRPGSSATDYTVQASAVVIATGAASALAGFSAQAFGFAGHFGLATVLALLGVVLVFRRFPKEPRWHQASRTLA
ncbi:MAG: MFS transporter [Myxococcota bacterium]|jgi:MFS family permease|nr:MFS transporter [Myxococcota bacterium]